MGKKFNKNNNKQDSKNSRGKGRGQGGKNSEFKKHYVESSRMGQGAQENRDNRVGNDPSWYNPSDALYSNATKLPFGFRLGDVVPTFAWNTPGGSSGNIDFRIPGILTNSTDLVYPCQGNPADPVNMAAISVYTWMNRQTGRVPSYGAADVMFRFMAMDSILSMIAHMTKAYYTLNYYEANSRYTPRWLISSMGIDYDDFVKSQTAFRDAMNNILLKLKTIAVPAVFPLFKRHSYLFSNIFKDVDNDYANLIIYNPRNVYKLTRDEDGLPYLQATTFVAPTSGVFTWSHYLDIIEDAINTLYNDQDTGIMSADIINAYGADSIVSLNQLAADVTIAPMFDAEYNNMLHNATIVSADNLDVTQVVTETDAGLNTWIKCTPTVNTNVSGPRDQFLTSATRLVDFHVEPGSDSIMKGSLLIVTADSFSTDSPVNAMTEIISNVGVWSLNDEITDPNPTFTIDSNVLAIDVVRMLDIATYMQISNAPILYIFYQTGANFHINLICPTDKVSSWSASNISRLHNVGTLGLFDVGRLIK